ncbi:MAG: FAD-dependent monooxygenase [Planctomycetota bacterium]
MTPLPEDGSLFDAVVVGAGPAGAVAAQQIAGAGQSVLLVDRDTFPRTKVCGGCLSGAGVRALQAAELGAVLADMGAPKLQSTRLFYRGREAQIALSDGVAVSRVALDQALADSAVRSGCTWLQGVAAELPPASPSSQPEVDAGWRDVTVHSLEDGRAARVRARVIVVATGLHKRGDRRRRRGLVGLGSIVPGNLLTLPPGEVAMLCSPHGYLGICTVENATTHLAAAVEATWLRAVGGPQKAIAALCRHSGADFQNVLSMARWRGTPQLATQPPITTTHRCLAIGDAAGAIAPFTGEGMGNAIQSAIAVAPIATAVANARSERQRRMHENEWRRQLQRLRRSQRTNRTIARLLRNPLALRSTHALLRFAPLLARPVVAGLGRPALRWRSP